MYKFMILVILFNDKIYNVLIKVIWYSGIYELILKFVIIFWGFIFN